MKMLVIWSLSASFYHVGKIAYWLVTNELQLFQQVISQFRLWFVFDSIYEQFFQLTLLNAQIEIIFVFFTIWFVTSKLQLPWIQMQLTSSTGWPNLLSVSSLSRELLLSSDEQLPNSSSEQSLLLIQLMWTIVYLFIMTISLKKRLGLNE